MSGQQQNTVETLLKAGVIAPTTINKNRQRHQRANYKEDVRPFASGLGWAFSLVTAGLIIGLAALVTVVFRGAQLFSPEQTLLLPETFITAAGAAAAAYGTGYALQLREMKEHFVRRLYRDDIEQTSYQPITHQPPAKETIILRTGKTATRIPGNIRMSVLATFVSDYLIDRTTFSEAGAHDYKIYRQQWKAFSAWTVEQGIMRWRNENHPQQGLVINGAAGHAALRAIATGEYNRS